MARVESTGRTPREVFERDKREKTDARNRGKIRGDDSVNFKMFQQTYQIVDSDGEVLELVDIADVAEYENEHITINKSRLIHEYKILKTDNDKILEEISVLYTKVSNRLEHLDKSIDNILKHGVDYKITKSSRIEKANNKMKKGN